MKVISIFLSALLLSSIYIISSSTPAIAEDEDVAVETADKVTAASGNNRFVAWYDNTPGNYEILFRRSTDNGATWQPTVNLSTNPGPSYIPQIAVSGSNVYVVWSQETTDNLVGNVYVRRSTDNGATWGPKVMVSTSGTNFSPSPQIAVFGTNAYITWYDDGTSDIFFRRSTDNGATWKSIVNISNNVGESFGPQIAALGSNVYVTWSDQTTGNPEILFRRSTDNGATWKAVKNLSNNAGNSYSQQIAASGSNVYVTWYDFTTVKAESLLRRSTDSGATWKSIVNISNNAGGSNSPQVTTVGSDVYIIWQDDTPGNDDIFLRRSADNGGTWKTVKNLSANAGFSYLVAVG